VQQALDDDAPADLTRMVADGLDPDVPWWGGHTTLAGRVFLFLLERLAKVPLQDLKEGNTEALRQWARWQRRWLDGLSATGFSWERALFMGNHFSLAFASAGTGETGAWSMTSMSMPTTTRRDAPRFFRQAP